MKTSIPRASAIRLLMLITLTATLFSFFAPVGMDSYKVYLNDKMLFKQYASKDAPVQSLSLSENASSDLLTIYYDHCGRIGTARTITLLDGQKVLKKWDYKDTKSIEASGMNCNVGDIKSLQKAGRTLKLIYASTELSTPIQLVTISAAGTDAKANR